jgi:Nucleotidyl transferase AbiEii toxin, Type IV TA system
VNKIARWDAARRAELFTETANRRGLSATIVEKDYWVCWTLKQIFSIDAFREMLLFKGGTSLSKVFGAIERFSEDIDLAVDYRLLGFVGKRDPRATGISRTKQTKLLGEMLEVCAAFIRTEFVDLLRARCRAILGNEGWDLLIDGQDAHVVRFHYPRSVEGVPSYIAPQVVLELGTHAEFVPRESFLIRSFAAAEFTNLFEDPDVSVTALLAKRTFLEKVTILHAEYFRDPDKPLPQRYSRHYYDVALMASGRIKQDALADRDLLAQVVRHKTTFYPAAWARYDLAVPGSLRVLPPEYRIRALKQDYREMAVMIFGDAPGFEHIMKQLSNLEAEINKP